MDPLSDILRILNVEGMLSACLKGSGPWALAFPAYRHIKFGGVIEGARWLWTEQGEAWTELAAGDFYLLSDGRPYRVASDPNAQLADGARVMTEGLGADGVVRYGEGDFNTVGAGGRFTLDEELGGWLLQLLPPLIVVRAAAPQAQALRPLLELIQLETRTVQPGATALAAQLAAMVLIQILRAHLASGACPGWLGTLADARMGRALALMHGDIAHPWTVAELAAAAAMSRTSFAERFRNQVGLPPLAYLARWRMTVARHALKSNDETLARIGRAVGYESETSFGIAFKRMVGESPGRYRSRFR